MDVVILWLMVPFTFWFNMPVLSGLLRDSGVSEKNPDMFSTVTSGLCRYGLPKDRSLRRCQKLMHD